MPRLGNFKYTAKLMTKTGRVRYIYGGSENLTPAVSRGGPIGSRLHQKSLFLMPGRSHAQAGWEMGRRSKIGVLSRSRTEIVTKRPIIGSVGRGPFGTVREYHPTRSSIRRYQRLVQRVKTMSSGRRPWSER